MPLNPSLYARLLAVFGEVRFSNRGVEGHAYEERRPGGKKALHVQHWGETYCVCCPYCGDRRFRLGFNWRYGLPDPSGDGRFPINFLCKCQHENCVPANAVHRTRLAEQLLKFQNVNVRSRPPCLTSSRGPGSQTPLSEVPPPGELVALTNLPQEHPAVAYLLGRGFGVETMRDFGLSFCERAERKYAMAEGRIICPIDFQGVRVGWQARYVGTPPSGRTPKYFTSPGMAKSRILYNLDRVHASPYLVAVEGVTDAWRIPNHSVALFGHDISDAQKHLLREFSGGQRPIFVMLDATEHERIHRYTRELRSMSVPAVPVQLPDELDPGGCSSASLYDLIRWAASQAGLSLDLDPVSP